MQYLHNELFLDILDAEVWFYGQMQKYPKFRVNTRRHRSKRNTQQETAHKCRQLVLALRPERGLL